jgi:hypothetical protein
MKIGTTDIKPGEVAMIAASGWDGTRIMWGVVLNSKYNSVADTTSIRLIEYNKAMDRYSQNTYWGYGSDFDARVIRIKDSALTPSQLQIVAEARKRHFINYKEDE